MALVGVLPARVSAINPDTPQCLGVQPFRILKFTPTALLELPQPSVQLAFEYGIAPTFTLQHEAGWLVPMGQASLFERGYSYSGIKIKTEIRKYLLSGQYYTHTPLQYFAFEGMVKHRRVREEEWRETQNGAYSRFVVIDHLRNQIAFHLKYGRMVTFGPDGKMYADSYIGIGLRRYAHDYRQVPFAGLAAETGLVPESYAFIAPSLALGVKIGFGL